MTGRPEAGTDLYGSAPAPLRAFLVAIDRLGRLDGWIGAGCLVALTTLMLTEVAVRALSNFLPFVPASISVAWEYSAYLMAACFTFGAAMTLRAGGHIRVALVLGALTPGGRRVLETAAALVGAAFTGFLALAMVRFTWTSFSSGQTSISSGTLLWIPQSAITFGFVLLALQFVARACEAALGLPLEDARLKVASVAE